MGGPNLEVFKFGMYIMFPIGIMYYFGTNLDEKFSVPDFWPKKEETHKLPYDRKEIEEELERLKTRRLAARARRMQLEGGEAAAQNAGQTAGASPILQSLQHDSVPSTPETSNQKTQGWSSWLR